MAEKGKGSFGYLKKTAVRQGLFALIMVAFCAGIFLFGFFVFPQYSVILTVISVLGMLPAAKCIVSMILFMRAEKHSCSDTLHQKLVDMAGDHKEKMLLGFDFYLTSYDANFPLCAALVQKDCCIAYTSWAKCDCNKAKAHIEEYMKKNGISGITVKVFSDENKFTERFGQLCVENTEVSETEKAMYRLLTNLSI